MKTFSLLFAITGLFLFSGCGSNYVPCNSDDIELIDSCLIGETIESAINKLHPDSLVLKPHIVSYRELHGVYFPLEEGCLVTLIVEKPLIMSDQQMQVDYNKYGRYIMNHRIKGVCWRKGKVRKVKTVGSTGYIGCKTWY